MALMSDDSNQRLGTLIRNARVSRRLTLQALAERSGVSVSSISAIERGTRKLTLPLADRILGAMELDLHLETQPMWEAIDTAIAEAARLPLKERIADWKIEFTSFVSWFADTPYIADGLMAAALQAAPVPVTAFEMVVSRDGDTLDRLTELFDEMRASRWNMYWLQWGGGTSLDPREAEEEQKEVMGADGRGRAGAGTERGRTPMCYRCTHGEFRLRLVDELEPALWTEIEELPTNCLHPISIFRKVPMLTRVRLPLVSLAEIQATDGYARRVLDRMRGTPGRT